LGARRARDSILLLLESSKSLPYKDLRELDRRGKLLPMATSPTDLEFVPLRPWRVLTHNLLGWYDTVHANRDMPWRQTRDPYAIWLSETMLQQTQVTTVKAYFARFLDRFPTIAALAGADVDAVLALWAGLGYYRRARHLHAAAQAMVQRHGGSVPSTVEELMALPGVGRYTAGAVASIAFGVAAPVVDGNVMRVVARLAAFDRNIADPRHAKFFWHAAGEIVQGAGPGGRYGDVNQAMMELGATVCVPPPARPACLLCPVKEFCRAYAEGSQLDLPVKARKKPVAERRGVAVVLVRSGEARDTAMKRRSDQAHGAEVLMMKRPAGVTWEGMWEFPVLGAATVEKHGNAKGAALRAMEERVEEALGVRVSKMTWRGEVVHTLTHRRMVYQVLRCEVTGGKERLPACLEGGTYVEARWVKWPLEKAAGLAYGRVVEKLAAAAAE
jgi:A/G-specific adenine glycosylase